MFNYPPARNSSVTWVVARIPADKIVDGRVSMQHVDGRAGMSFGGWSGGIWYARREAKQSGEARYILPVIIGHRNGGAYVAQYVVGQGYMSLGVDGDGKNVPVPRFVN